MSGIAGRDERAARPDQHSPGGAGCLDRSFDDQAHQLLGVVRRAERLAETRGDVAQAPALCLELVETRLKLESHLVERSAEQRELVSALNRHALLQVSTCDCVSSVHKTPNRAHDRAAFDVGHRSDEYERGDEADEKLIRRLPVRSVDE